jgi:tRNA A-37 threonylcarbamoyl transferase component Bud32
MENIFSKPNVSEYEYQMQLYIYNLHILNVPEPISYDKTTKIFKMKKINGMSLSDYYGEKSIDIDSNIFKSIREIIQTLFDVGIIYPDITGYNFIAEYDDQNEISEKLWIIDFEHARFYDPNYYDSNDEYVKDFIDGYNSYNLEFA